MTPDHRSNHRDRTPFLGASTSPWTEPFRTTYDNQNGFARMPAPAPTPGGAEHPDSADTSAPCR
ncbi:MAG: hypothetical protein Kow0063_02510 [Anaerolineae bacterium]